MLVQLQEHCAGEQVHHIEWAKPRWLGQVQVKTFSEKKDICMQGLN